MTYQPIPFSLIMPEVPAYVTDGEIATLWGGVHSYIRSIEMEPFVDNSKRLNRVTIHFDDFKGYGDELREQIINGFYKTGNLYRFPSNLATIILECSYLLPCETPDPPRTEYSHVVALQLQDVVKKQAKRIHRLEARLNEMETKNSSRDDCRKAIQIERLEARVNKMKTTIREGTELQLDIQQTYSDVLERLESQLLEQDSYRLRLEAKMASIQELHIEDMKKQLQEKEELKQKIDALTEWCSQPVWKRTSAFVLPKAPEEEFVSEF